MATLSFVMSVCVPVSLSFHIKNSVPHSMDFHEISYLNIFQKSVEKIKEKLVFYIKTQVHL